VNYPFHEETIVMSQLFPDVPELEAVPPVLRSGLWMRAYRLAFFSPQTWVLAFAWTATGTCVGAILGYRLLGALGAFLLGVTVMCAAAYLFLRILLQWLARMRLAQVQSEAGWAAQEERLVITSNKTDALLAEQRRREGIDE
jgi:hypothetical protein